MGERGAGDETGDISRLASGKVFARHVLKRRHNVMNTMVDA